LVGGLRLRALGRGDRGGGWGGEKFRGGKKVANDVWFGAKVACEGKRERTGHSRSQMGRRTRGVLTEREPQNGERTLKRPSRTGKDQQERQKKKKVFGRQVEGKRGTAGRKNGLKKDLVGKKNVGKWKIERQPEGKGT